MPYKENSPFPHKNVLWRCGLTIITLLTLNLSRDAQAQEQEPENPAPDSIPGWVVEDLHAIGHQELAHQTAVALTNARLRERATTNSRSSGMLEAGEEVMVLREVPDGQRLTINGITSRVWYEVVRENGTRAFVWSGLLNVTEVIEAEEVPMSDETPIDDYLPAPHTRPSETQNVTDAPDNTPDMPRTSVVEAETTPEATPSIPDIPPEIRVSFPDVNNHTGNWIDLLLEVNQEGLMPGVVPGLIEDTTEIPAVAELEALIEERFRNGDDTEFNQSAMSGILVDLREGRSRWIATVAFPGDDGNWYTMAVALDFEFFLVPIDEAGDFVASEEERFVRYQSSTRVSEGGIRVDSNRRLQPGEQIVVLFYDPPAEAEDLTPTARHIRSTCGNRSPSEALLAPDEDGIIYSQASGIVYHE